MLIEARGRQHALGTTATLGKNLMRTVERESTEAAIAFYNERA